MKHIKTLVGILIAGGLLLGCTNKSSNCFPGQRCNEHEVYTRCGSYLKYECENICNRCKAYEPSCYSCWACISSDPEACLNSHEYGGRCGN